jgi:cytochrome c oxidase assembly protein subunit 15
MGMANLGLHRYSILLAACTLFLVVAGASVTSNEAGLSVPDWPLSYGKIMPPMTGGVFYEHGHRMVATTVGILTIVLAIWLWRSDRRQWMKRLGLAALGLVIIQGVLGGLTVLFMLPKWVSIAHACLAEIFFSTTVAIAIFTSPAWQRGPVYVVDAGAPSLRSLAIIMPAAVWGQVALGAAFRHRALNVIPHIVGAMVVSAIVLYVAIAVIAEHKTHPALRKPAMALITVTFVQVFLGIAAYLSRLASAESIRPGSFTIVFTVLHVAVGALTLAASVALSIQIRRHVAPQHAPVLETA